VAVDAETFEEHRSMEAYRVGWAAGALALDGDGRALLAYHGEDDTWMAPGGTLRPGETLTEGLQREIREETGIEVEPVRPHAVNEWTVRHDGRSASFRFVLFEAQPATTEVGDDLDAADGEITDAGWFETLPGNTLNREQTRSVLQRCRDG
jgi:ADP-ribose pyrophosphatase YjhB (NUDIX family)